MPNQASAPSISVIVVTWNSSAHLPRCLDCLDAQTFKDFELVLVDNASIDDPQQILDSHPHAFTIRMERLRENRGFAFGNNIGANLAQGTWLALLNSDAFPQPDWLASLHAATQQYPDFSFFASRQVQADTPDCLDGAGDVVHFSGLAWRRFLNGPVEKLGLDPEEVFSPCAAAALYQRDAFLSVGGFDEDFFSYHEDVDLGFRLRLAGHRCMYVPQAVVSHIGSASTGKKSAFGTYHKHRNVVWTYVKDMPGLLFWLYLPYHVFMNLFFLLYFSFNGDAAAIWKSKWNALQGLGLMLRKRKRIQNGRTASLISIYNQMDQNWLAPLSAKAQQRQFSRQG